MKDKLFGLLEPVVAALGYELLDVESVDANRLRQIVATHVV